MKTLSERIGAALAAGFTRAQLADAAKKTGAAVSHWQSGLVKSLKADSAAGLAKLTGWNVDWWISGKGPQFSEIPPSAVRSYSDTNLVRAPVVEWARLGEDLRKPNEDWPAEAMRAINSTKPMSGLVKWVEVQDDLLAPRVLKGDWVAVDPDGAPRMDSLVLAKAADGSYMLRFYRPLAGGAFEVIDGAGRTMDSLRHGIQFEAAFVTLQRDNI